jgi:cellulose synthase/poly-beta-1,6-N-acetylglucosamine synthase-like glycosyltransferase
MNFISVVTPVYHLHNTVSYLGAALKSLQLQSYQNDKIELVIIGDACIPLESCIPVGMLVKIYSFRNHVPLSTLRNKGIELASSEFVAFLDADCMAHQDWLLHLAKGFNEKDIAGCAGACMNSHGNCINKDHIFAVDNLLPFSSTASVMFKKEILKEVGGFDDNLLHKIEDLDLGWRLYLKGYRLEYVPRAIVYEEQNKSFKDEFFAGISGRNVDRKYKKIFGPANIFQYLKVWPNKKNMLIVFSGYFFELIREKLGLTPYNEEVDLTDKYLSKETQKILNVAYCGSSLFKPNYVVWWNIDNGCRLINLKERKYYYLEDVSKEIWNRMMKGDLQEKIIEALSIDYGLGNKILNNDFEDFIQDLCEKELLTA